MDIIADIYLKTKKFIIDFEYLIGFDLKFNEGRNALNISKNS